MISDVLIVVPTLNPGDEWRDWIDAYSRLEPRPDCLVIDSSSSDRTTEIARESGIRVHVIERAEFDHGGTRNLALGMTDSRIIVFMTQDAIADGPDAVLMLLRSFDDPDVAAVYGRQVPCPGADVFGAYARLRNYPLESHVRRYRDRERFGIKTAFMSNSFAAYRRDVLEQIGGFPDGLIFAEDMVVTARLLQKGWKIAYAADARVIHSHDYSPMQEFRRYFDMGVLHADQPWIRRDFGSAEKEGISFVLSEMCYVLKHAFWRLPEALVRTVLRYTGFRLGLHHARMPMILRRRMSMNAGYFRPG